MTRRQLSQQQALRVRKRQEQRRQCMDDDSNTDNGQTGLIISHYGKVAVVESEDGILRRCSLRRHIETLACGDRVIWETTADGQGVITALQPRQSLLQRPDSHGHLRPVAANIDQIAVIIAPYPPASPALIDRYLVAIEAIAVTALLVLNKVDLLTGAEHAAWRERLAVYPRIGYPIIETSTRQSGGLDKLVTALAERTSLLVGQSGVGKSSLIQTLLPERAIRTQALSTTTGLGTHTTSVSTLYPLSTGGKLIDSPGVRSFEPSAVDVADLAGCFREFRPFLAHCRFANCRHTAEPGCAVLAATQRGEIHPQRLASYHTLHHSFQ